MSFKDSPRRSDDGVMARVPTAPRPPLIRPWLRNFGAVWLLNALIAAAAALLYVLHAQDLGPIAEPHLPVWALIVAFIAGERAVVHLHFRRSAHSFSFGDVPLVLGLLFASTPQLVVARARGHRRAAGPRPPAAADQDRVQPRPDGAGHVRRGHRPARHHRPADEHRPRGLDRRPRGGRGERDPHGRADRRWPSGSRRAGCPSGMARDMVTRDLAVTVTNTSLALAASVLIAVDARSLPLLVVPGDDGLPRLPGLHRRAPAPRAARVPLRGHPHARALARDHPRARGAC